MMLWLLLACAGESPRYPEVTAALMARVDQDGDGRVSAAEYKTLAFVDEPMSTCDSDGDAFIDALELEACFLNVNPTRLQAERRRVWMETEVDKRKAGKAEGKRRER